MSDHVKLSEHEETAARNARWAIMRANYELALALDNTGNGPAYLRQAMDAIEEARAALAPALP